MAINSLNSKQKWVELASANPTSGTTVTFSSLPQYKTYKIAYFNLDLSTGDIIQLTINNDTGNNYAYARQIDSGDTSSAGVSTSILLGTVATDGTGIITIDDANDLIKDISWFHAVTFPSLDSVISKGFWNSQNVINRFDISTSTATFSSGTIKVYGRN